MQIALKSLTKADYGILIGQTSNISRQKIAEYQCFLVISQPICSSSYTMPQIFTERFTPY